MMPFRWAANNFVCFFCDSVFKQASELKNHNKVEHDTPKVLNLLKRTSACRTKFDVSEVACRRCPKAMKDLNEFLDHASAAHDIEINKEVTNSIFCVKLSDEEMQCLDCNERFKFFGPLVTHTHKFHNAKEEFACEICSKKFVRKSTATQHQSLHHKEAECDKCLKKFKSKYLLQVHKDKEHKKFKCTKCPELFNTIYMKKRHMAKVHDEKFKCDSCDKFFLKNNELLKHKERMHLQLKSIVCSVCGFRVFSKDLLKLHMVKHDETRAFECDICKKKFKRKKNLDFHCRIHTNDCRYACKECGKAFVQVTSLKVHVRVHHPTPATEGTN